MTDISITAANVAAGADARKERGTAGETITAGQVVYKSASDSRYYLADADESAAAQRTPLGVALNGASAGQPLEIQKGGSITIGATLTPGTTYYLSDAPGGICPLADLASGDYYCIIGIAESASVLALGIKYSGVSA